ncbi:hypothetical protein RD792_012448 [Penstemon davidsonii]|uniref:RST domain-containing protein n=1 Tax=Penstemon davidsonii TaxID=160366 RepID=A0ABR0CX94_9LAMI|nr:hypothetical protein RD792_012448 [Penstemon davidsonii]
MDRSIKEISDMDPNIMKLLEEDEDETMHSGADVEAFTAELNRDIEGNSSLSQQPSDSESAALSQGNGQTASQFLPQWQTSGHDGIVNFQSGEDFLLTGLKDQLPSQLDQQQHDTESLNPKEEDGSSHEFNTFSHNASADTCTDPQKDDQNIFTVSQPVSMQTSEKQPVQVQNLGHKPNSGVEPQQHKFQNMSDQQSMAIGSNNQKPVAMELNDQHPFSREKGNQQTSMGLSNHQAKAKVNHQAGTSLKSNKQVPFGMLLPIIQPQLDKDRAMQLQTLYLKLKKNEISKGNFIQHMRSIVGDQMLKIAVCKLENQARNSQPAPNQFQSQPHSSGRQLQVSSSVESQGDLQGVQVGQMSTSSLNQERKHPVPAQGLNKQQQMHFAQTSFPTHGSAGSSYSPFSATNVASSTSLRPQPHDLQMRQASAQQTMTSSHLGPTTQAMNTKKMQAGTPTHTNSNTALQPNPVQWPSSTSKEQKIGVSSSMNYVKQEPVDQLGNMNDESFEMHSSRMGFTPPTSMVPTNSLSSFNPSSRETNSLSNTRMPSLTSSIGPSKAPPKKPLVGQKKPMEAPGSLTPPSSKKQKVSGGFLDQSIEQLNDVTAVSGVNLREEAEQLFSGSKEDSRVSEATRRVVQEEEERLILHKIPLQKKVVEIMAKSGLKSMSNDVERCLSLCVEERMRGLIASLIRLSKQRVDIEKPRHRTIITSDIRQQIMTINRKAREEWEKKQAETEKSLKQIDPESGAGVDGDKEKDETRAKSVKANKEEDDKMRTTAANVAVRAATGVGDMLSRWQLMIEAKQKQGGTDTSSGSQIGKDVARKPLQTSTKNTRENQETDKWDPAAALNTPGSVRKVGRNQVVMSKVARSITVKDVIAILEREPQMSKSTLIYRLYDKIKADVASE